MIPKLSVGEYEFYKDIIELKSIIYHDRFIEFIDKNYGGKELKGLLADNSPYYKGLKRALEYRSEYPIFTIEEIKKFLIGYQHKYKDNMFSFYLNSLVKKGLIFKIKNKIYFIPDFKFEFNKITLKKLINSFFGGAGAKYQVEGEKLIIYYKRENKNNIKIFKDILINLLKTNMIKTRKAYYISPSQIEFKIIKERRDLRDF